MPLARNSGAKLFDDWTELAGCESFVTFQLCNGKFLGIRPSFLEVIEKILMK
jgi:uncharacterized protein YlzI (FlbEa/FlbD family)